jgi:hypothetical protein
VYFQVPDTWEREDRVWGFASFGSYAMPQTQEPLYDDDEIVVFVNVGGEWYQAPIQNYVALAATKLCGATFSKGDLERAMSECGGGPPFDSNGGVVWSHGHDVPRRTEKGGCSGWVVEVHGSDSHRYYGHDRYYLLSGDGVPFAFREKVDRYYDTIHGKVTRVIRAELTHCSWDDGILPNLPYRDSFATPVSAERENRRERRERRRELAERLKDASARNDYVRACARFGDDE